MANPAKLRHPVRVALVMGVFVAVTGVLAWRLVDLHVMRKDFLQGQGDARSLRVVATPAHRGMIVDRHGEALAISTPVDSVWANPAELMNAREEWDRLAKALGLDADRLERTLAARAGREFTYLKRHIHPDLAQQVMALRIPGVSLQREYRRYYPTGEVSGHLVGFTNVDDAGQEGLELAFDEWLRGQPGSKRVIKDRLGSVIENVESIRKPRPGKDLTLSIDRRIQYLAYRELKAAIKKHRAKSGSAVLLDARSGEVLAVVNQPAFNPNNRSNLRGDRYRNRAVTDVFEPGSTVKPFTVATALELGRYRPDTVIDTAPGMLRVGRHAVRDIRNYGAIDVETVIQKSSNVGVSKLALAMPAETLWNTFSRVGFGQPTASTFPGESGGLLSFHGGWSEIERATLSFGYGLSVTPLQLAQAYTVFATDGVLRPVTFQRVSDDTPHLGGERIFSKRTVRQVRAMLEKAVGAEGTGQRAQVPGYRVAGKTGTVKKSTAGGYADDRYLSVFAGLAPASNPRLVMVVMINEPSNGEYYGGRVAAPVFGRVMAGALRLLNVPPDDLETLQPHVTQLAERAAAGQTARGGAL